MRFAVVALGTTIRSAPSRSRLVLMLTWIALPRTAAVKTEAPPTATARASITARMGRWLSP